jgi:hypothetical protein
MGAGAMILAGCTPLPPEEQPPIDPRAGAAPPISAAAKPRSRAMTAPQAVDPAAAVDPIAPVAPGAPVEAVETPAQPRIVAKLRPEIKINDDPGQLLGLDGDNLTGLLGAPRFTRRDPPAQLWRYRGKSCVLDVFLFKKAGSGSGSGSGSVVRHFEARSLSKTSMTARICLRALLIARAQPKAG